MTEDGDLEQTKLDKYLLVAFQTGRTAAIAKVALRTGGHREYSFWSQKMEIVDKGISERYRIGRYGENLPGKKGTDFLLHDDPRTDERDDLVRKEGPKLVDLVTRVRQLEIQAQHGMISDDELCKQIDKLLEGSRKDPLPRDLLTIIRSIRGNALRQKDARKKLALPDGVFEPTSAEAREIVRRLKAAIKNKTISRLLASNLLKSQLKIGHDAILILNEL